MDEEPCAAPDAPDSGSPAGSLDGAAACEDPAGSAFDGDASELEPDDGPAAGADGAALSPDVAVTDDESPCAGAGPEDDAAADEPPESAPDGLAGSEVASFDVEPDEPDVGADVVEGLPGPDAAELPLGGDDAAPSCSDPVEPELGDDDELGEAEDAAEVPLEDDGAVASCFGGEGDVDVPDAVPEPDVPPLGVDAVPSWVEVVESGLEDDELDVGVPDVAVPEVAPEPDVLPLGADEAVPPWVEVVEPGLGEDEMEGDVPDTAVPGVLLLDEDEPVPP